MPAAPTHPAAKLAAEWVDAWNACDADRIVDLVHPEFRMHRMKGDVIDRDGLRDAVERQTYGAAMRLFPRRLYGRDEHFAAAARIEYRHVEEDELIGATDDGGMAFELREGAMVMAAPQPTLRDALAYAGLTEQDLLATWDAGASDGALPGP